MGRRILIVDDQPTNVKLVQVLLEGEGFETCTAGDAEQALAAVASFRPDLVLMDLQLPGVDGLELTRRLKADPATAALPVVALTSYAMKGDEERARAAGCDGYLTKPIDTRTFVARVAAHLPGAASGSVATTDGAAPLAPPPPATAPAAADVAPAGPAEATILVVEDNPVTRKMIRVALVADGLAVIEAGDGAAALRGLAGGHPDLVLQDMALPDMDGVQLLAEIRRRPEGQTIPVLILSGSQDKLDALRASGGAFDDFLTKPVEPSRLLATIRRHLALRVHRVQPSRGQRVLVVDDEPLNRKLVELRLQHEGFAVRAHGDAVAALAAARADPPDAILADVLMPGMDGFRFCQAVRAEPALAGVPVVLVSAAYVEAADRELARRMGANALVPRTSDYREVAEALAAQLGAVPPAAVATAPDPGLEELYRERLAGQLEEQIRANRELRRRAGLHAATLSVIAHLSDKVGWPVDLAEVLATALVHCLDATGLSTGLLYLLDEDGGVQMQAHLGLESASVHAAGRVFGIPDRLRAIIAAGAPVTFESDGADPDATAVTGGLAHRSVLVIPLVAGDCDRGALVLASDSHLFSDGLWSTFSRALSSQLGQTIALGQAVARLAASEHVTRLGEERYRALFAGSPLPMWVFRPSDLRILDANRAAVAQYGYTREELLGMTVRDIRAPGQEEPASLTAEAQTDGQGSRAIGTWRHLRRDGQEVHVEVHLDDVELAGEPVRLAVLHDVTERRRLEEQFRQAQKMEAIGRLAGGIAHDFNNLLTVILGCTETLLDQPSVDPERQRALLGEVAGAGERAAALTRQLLAFSRQQVVATRPLDLNAVIAGMSDLLRRLIGEDVVLATVLAPRLGRVRADTGQMEQVLMNLAVNARDAMPRGGTLTLATRDVAIAPGSPRDRPPLFAGRFVCLSVSDTGTGIDAATRAHLFEPFFTTKEIGKGTGLGLATVYGIVQQSGGAIEVESEPGRGARFDVYLPVIDGSGPAAGETAPRGAHAAGSETVLLVEDEEGVRRLTAELLETAGYRVLQAANPAEALAIVERRGDEIDLLLSDVVMPGMRGTELAARVAGRLPGIRTLLVTGYSDPAVFEVPEGAPPVSFLPKPFRRAELLRRVRELLDARP